jgi:hypothetical protein
MQTPLEIYRYVHVEAPLKYSFKNSVLKCVTTNNMALSKENTSPYTRKRSMRWLIKEKQPQIIITSMCVPVDER